MSKRKIPNYLKDPWGGASEWYKQMYSGEYKENPHLTKLTPASLEAEKKRKELEELEKK